MNYNKMLIRPYNNKSLGAKTLSKGLGMRVASTQRILELEPCFIINWGNSRALPIKDYRSLVMNSPDNIGKFINKNSFNNNLNNILINLNLDNSYFTIHFEGDSIILPSDSQRDLRRFFNTRVYMELCQTHFKYYGSRSLGNHLIDIFCQNNIVYPNSRFFIRRRIDSSGGKGIIVCKGINELINKLNVGDYWVEDVVRCGEWESNNSIRTVLGTIEIRDHIFRFPKNIYDHYFLNPHNDIESQYSISESYQNLLGIRDTRESFQNVHFFQRKLKDLDCHKLTTEEQKEPIKNFKNGWKFRKIRHEEIANDKFLEQLLIAIKKITNKLMIKSDLNFAAFDIIATLSIFGEYHNEYLTVSILILEANTAPGLSRLTTEFYIKNFQIAFDLWKNYIKEPSSDNQLHITNYREIDNEM